MDLLKLKTLRFLAKIPVVRTPAKKIAHQLAQKIPDALISEIFTGQKMLLSVQDWVQYHLFMYGFYELPESLFWLNFTKGKKVVLDVGGNVGYFSLLAAKGLNKNGKIYAFEPVSKTYKRFQENIRLNGTHSIVLEKLAISNKEDVLTINVGNAHNWGMSSINMHEHLSGDKEIVRCETIDGYIKKHNLSVVDIVKIDIEGSEFAAIDGMKNTLSIQRPVVLIELLDAHLSKQGYSCKDIYNLFWSKGYTAYEIQKNNRLQEIKEAKSYDGLVCFYPSEKEMEAFVQLMPGI